MDISEFTLRLLLLFFPGIICAYIVDALTVHRPRQPFFFMIQSFAMGLSSYFLYWLFCLLFNRCFPRAGSLKVGICDALIDKTVAISFTEVGFATATAVLLGVFITLSRKFKLPFRIAHMMRITNKFGELDVWGYTMNVKEIDWLTVRDHKNDLIYDGWIQAFSDDSQDAEMLLRDVSVYKNSSGESLYQVGALYLSRNRDDITFECRTIPVDEQVQWKGNVNARQEATDSSKDDDK